MRRAIPKKRMKPAAFKTLMVKIVLMLLSVVTVTTSSAYLTSSPDPLENTFSRPEIELEILENFDQETKTGLGIKNTGNTDVFVRAAVLIQAEAADGSVLAYTPSAGDDYTMSSLGAGWFHKDGYYYHRSPIAAGQETGVLFAEIKALRIPLLTFEGTDYYLSVHVVSQVIQTSPIEAVQEVWPVSVSAGQLVP
ncbi:MAG: hypothetical protein WDA02_11115 [Saccharofermentanales bacterium]